MLEIFVGGVYTVDQVVVSGFSQTYPASLQPHTVAIGLGQTVENLDFGNRPGPLQTVGYKYHDLDGDGRRDEDEPGIEGIWIYVDHDGDGRMDLGNPRRRRRRTVPIGSHSRSPALTWCGK